MFYATIDKLDLLGEGTDGLRRMGYRDKVSALALLEYGEGVDQFLRCCVAMVGGRKLLEIAAAEALAIAPEYTRESVRQASICTHIGAAMSYTMTAVHIAGVAKGHTYARNRVANALRQFLAPY